MGGRTGPRWCVRRLPSFSILLHSLAEQYDAVTAVLDGELDCRGALSAASVSFDDLTPSTGSTTRLRVGHQQPSAHVAMLCRPLAAVSTPSEHIGPTSTRTAQRGHAPPRLAPGARSERLGERSGSASRRFCTEPRLWLTSSSGRVPRI